MEVEDLLHRLESAYDVEDWWPADSPWEVMVGAILTQQTVWESAEKVLDEMKKRGLMTVEGIDRLPIGELETLLRPAGFYRQKARSLKALATHIRERYASDPRGLLTKETEKARKELLSIRGIGNETADAILLFAAGRPCFVAAKYVSRTLGRLGMIDSRDYIEVQRFLECRLEPDPAGYAKYYALFVQHARSTCRTRPRCEACTLHDDCSFSPGRETAGSPPRPRTRARR
ncbi:MAG: hypothetical protein SA339_03590 [Methanomassiliicoccus sp.]|nr:hypothetical protein [Methanomassiliicoccus sp.]